MISAFSLTTQPHIVPLNTSARFCLGPNSVVAYCVGVKAYYYEPPCRLVGKKAELDLKVKQVLNLVTEQCFCIAMCFDYQSIWIENLSEVHESSAARCP